MQDKGKQKSERKKNLMQLAWSERNQKKKKKKRIKCPNKNQNMYET